MHVLVTGAGGQVGLERQRLGTDEVRLVAPSRDELELARPEMIAAALGAGPWSAVNQRRRLYGGRSCRGRGRASLNCERARSGGPRAETGRAGIPLIHVSTDFVLSGDKQGPYDEDDLVGPLGVDGSSKLGGEAAVRTGNSRHAIVRTLWVVSAHRTGFVQTMLRPAAERPVLRVVDDQQGCLTCAADLAAALLTAALALARDPQGVGTYHSANAGATTWCRFAREIFAQAQARGEPTAEVQAITRGEFPAPARRPRNSRLSTPKFERTFGIVPRRWEAGLAEILDQLVPVEPHAPLGSNLS